MCLTPKRGTFWPILRLCWREGADSGEAIKIRFLPSRPNYIPPSKWSPCIQTQKVLGKTRNKQRNKVTKNKGKRNKVVSLHTNRESICENKEKLLKRTPRTGYSLPWLTDLCLTNLICVTPAFMKLPKNAQICWCWCFFWTCFLRLTSSRAHSSPASSRTWRGCF